MRNPLGRRLEALAERLLDSGPGRAVRGFAGAAPVRLALAAVALGLAGWLIWRQVRGVDAASLLAALEAAPASGLAASVACTALSFAGLSLAEWEALKVIGRPQPPVRTALAAFQSNALSVVLGFGVISGAAVRLRTYGFAGLKAAEIARLVLLLQVSTFIAGIVAEGLFVLGAAGSAPGPGRGPLGVAAGLVLLAPAALWFILFRSGEAAFGTADRVAALGGALGDWLFSGAALFVLSPQALTLYGLAGFAPFMAAFCLGSLIGAAVGVPGGLGVLEAVMLSLGARAQLHETAAALILYRVIYFLGPLAVAGVLAAGQRLVRLVRSGAGLH